ncbi:MAG: lytic transglycosylase domain-containing protein [Pseudomonadota bacterium]
MSRIFLSILLVCGLNGLPVLAEGPKPFPEFSAKRVTPPKSGSAKRITIQIEPEDAVALGTDVAADVPDTPRRAGSFDWFWARVSDKASDATAGRLEQAMTTLAGADVKVPAPRLQEMQDIARVTGRDILLSTIGTSVSPALVLAVIAIESAGKADAVSGAGAQGLMQLMPDTAARFGVTDSFAADQNIRGGVQYLNWLMEEFDRDPILVLAGYNAGEGSIRKYEGVPPFTETRDYVPKVLAAFQVAQGLCLTPPELITDGCVFAVMN